MEQQQKKNPPSLPSNYVTLAQLQERWLKQQNQVNQPQQQHQHQQREEDQQQHVAVVAPTKSNVTDSVSRSHPAKQYRRKNRDDSGRKSRAAEVVASEDRRKSETAAENGDENADADGKVDESKNKREKEMRKVKWKPKVEERGASEEGTGAAQGNEDAEKTTIESELNDKKEGDSVTVGEEVEQKFGDLSMNPGKGKQNEGLRRMTRRSQSQRNYRGGYGYGHSRGQRQRFEGEKMVWVRKDRGVGKIET